MTQAPSFSARLFYLLSLGILFSDAALVALNWYSTERTLASTLRVQSESIKNAFDVSIAQVFDNLLQTATFISSNPEVQQLFYAGKQAVEAEGGSKGGDRAAYYRSRLFQSVAPGWQAVMRDYDVRQLHFHLAPGSLSFLRVHRPERFGDHMDDVRHMVVDTTTYRRANVGFETGRIYSGLRAVVPVYAAALERTEPVFVGALEAGTSFAGILNSLENITEAETLVFLNEAHVRKAMWKEFIGRQLERLDDQCRCFIEAASSQRAIDIFLNTANRQAYRNQGLETFRARFGRSHYAVSRFPLFDYHSLQGVERPPVGSVAILTDISAVIEATDNQLRLNIAYAILGFILLELLLFYALRLGSRKLHGVIAAQTAEITQLKEHFEQQASIDGLTRLYNHRHLIERLHEELARARRDGQALSLIMLDLDHFKAVNDNHGHRTGDRLLEASAVLIKQVSRSGDIAARYGGEEFCLVLPGSDRAGALRIAERLLQAFREQRLPVDGQPPLSWSASIGVAQWDGEESVSDFIHKADLALYRAKQRGRDRIETAAT